MIPSPPTKWPFGITYLSAAAKVRFDGSQHLTLRFGMAFSEAENLMFRFKTSQKDTFLIATRTDDSTDRLEMYLGK